MGARFLYVPGESWRWLGTVDVQGKQGCNLKVSTHASSALHRKPEAMLVSS